MDYQRHRIYISTFQPTEDPPWVDVTTKPTFFLQDRADTLTGDLADESLDYVHSLPKWREAQRFIRDATAQQEALTKLAEQKNPDASSLKTATATLANLKAKAEEDVDMARSVLKIKRRQKRQMWLASLIQASAYVVRAGGDCEACGIEMQGEPYEWMQHLPTQDILSIRQAAIGFAGLSEDERQDLLTPRPHSLATPRHLREDSSDIEPPQNDGSDSMSSGATAKCGAPVA